MSGALVVNIIELRDALPTWDGLPLVALSDVPGENGVAVQPGDTLVDAKTSTFARITDAIALATAKQNALAEVDAANAALTSIADGSLRAQIAAATDLDEVELATSAVELVKATF
ncbi:MAG TPA: hypothetical protein VK571_09110 [Gemmatimonadaceae bacterium]|nr:hypothetical protein [Gemmatimonadaceae bacterium]